MPSIEDFRAGKNIKVIELNGVSSEATYIYDPQYSLFSAYRILFRQWRIAFEISEKNRDAGAQPIRVRDIFSLFFKSRSKRVFFTHNVLILLLLLFYFYFTDIHGPYSPLFLFKSTRNF